MRSFACLLLAALTVVSMVGCGESKTASAPPSAAQPTTPGAPEGPGRPADPAAVRVIRAWSDAQRASDLDRASSFFALPSIVSNGAGPERLQSRADARRFSGALPCGARLLRTSASPGGRYTIATFRLVSRPGARCDGPGAHARTAFDVRAGKIRAWLRIADAPSDRPSPSPPQVPDDRPPDGGGPSV